MHHHIIESIGHWGVKTSPYEKRMGKVRGGDIVGVPETLRRYPCTSAYSRIANVDENGIVHVCEAMGSGAHLLEDGSCDISGGPWWGVPASLLKPNYELRQATYWNWGDNSPGANQGVYYNIYRPVHTLTVHPDDIKQRYAKDESGARKGKYAHEKFLDSDWTLYLKGKKLDSDGEYLWVFLSKPVE